jgi:lipoprotein NlpD
VRRGAALALLALAALGACTHARVVQREPGARPAARAAPARPAVSPLPSDATHVVHAGETLYGISFRYGLRYQDVAAWNGIADPYLIEVGQRLRLSSSARPPAPALAARPPLVRPGPTPAPPGAPAVAPPLPAPAPPGLPAPRWRWPAEGQIVGRYVPGDQTRQGIDIAGRGGQDVLASADGVVVYSGAGLVGYGELIIVKHSEEWLSAYAHNQQRLVSEGTRVGAGQLIARMGHSGASREMLHFEIRRNGKPVDPLGLLPRR